MISASADRREYGISEQSSSPKDKMKIRLNTNLNMALLSTANTVMVIFKSINSKWLLGMK